MPDAAPTSQSDGANSLWATFYANGKGGLLATGIDTGLAIVLFVFLGFVMFQWRKGKRKQMEEESVEEAQMTLPSQAESGEVERKHESRVGEHEEGLVAEGVCEEAELGADSAQQGHQGRWGFRVA